ncbi:MAG: hypothetical protein WAS33_16320 [Candidatus Promineifilaceae bacterium]
MTKEDDFLNLKALHKKHGKNSRQYRNAYKKYKKVHEEEPGRGLEPPDSLKRTNGGSHDGDSGFFGAKKRS